MREKKYLSFLNYRINSEDEFFRDISKDQLFSTILDGQDKNFEVDCLNFRNAARTNNVEELKRIFSKNKNVINSKDDRTKKTALYLAVESGAISAYEFLLVNDADPSIQDSKGNTVFDLIKDAERIKIIEASLLDGLALLTKDVKNNKSLLDMATFEDDQWHMYDNLKCYKFCNIAQHIIDLNSKIIDIKSKNQQNNFSLNPVLLFELHHTGLVPFLRKALPKLRKLGYKALLIEQSIEHNLEMFIEERKKYLTKMHEENNRIVNKLSKNVNVLMKYLALSGYQECLVEMVGAKHLLDLIDLAKNNGFEILFNDPDPIGPEGERALNSSISKAIHFGSETNENDTSSILFHTLRNKGIVKAVDYYAHKYDGGIICSNGLAHAEGMLELLNNMKTKYKVSPYHIVQTTTNPKETDNAFFNALNKEMLEENEPLCKKLNIPIVTVDCNDEDFSDKTVEIFIETEKVRLINDHTESFDKDKNQEIKKQVNSSNVKSKLN